MEDWQEWQIRADQIAESLNADVRSLDAEYFSAESANNLRSFWPRFRDLKERVRTAPAIRLEAKLDLEKQLRGLGARAYKLQEATFSRSNGRKDEILAAIAALRETVDALKTPRELRTVRRDIDRIREQFDAGSPLVAPDRQAVWDAWREASQFVWQRLTAAWDENEAYLRAILVEARQHAESSNVEGVRQSVGRFFEALRTREAKQESIVQMKAEAEGIRREVEALQERRQTQRVASQAAQSVPAIDSWKAEVQRNREAIARLASDVAELERQIESSTSILEQAMVRGSLVDKKRKLSEYERSTRVLEQRIETSEEAPLMSAG